MISKGNIKRFTKPYRITDGKSFRLKNIDPADTGKLGSGDKEEARSLLRDGVELLSELQEELYAQDLWGILLIFQAMDAAGNDSTIKHVMSGINPQGCAVECYLTRNGIAIYKFFLHVSREEQRKRFQERLEQPNKNWKFSVADAREREHRGDYMHAYEQMVRHISQAHAPWFVVPAGNKWFTHLVVAAAVIDTLQGMDLAYPEIDAEKRQELRAVRELLDKENGSPKKIGPGPSRNLKYR